MATVSFDKKINIRDNKTMDVLIKGLSKKTETMYKDKKNVIAEINRGKELLKQL